MNFGKDKQHILTSKQKYFSFVFKYRKNLFPVIVECTQHHSITQGILHIHLLLNCVHKYTDIYHVIDLLALQVVVVVDKASTTYPSPEFYSQIHRNF